MMTQLLDHLESHPGVIFPMIPGFGGSGIVVRVGADVRGFSENERVFFMHDGAYRQRGCFAEYTSVSARKVAHIPRCMSFSEAATVPLCATEAWQCLHGICKIKHGDKVVVHGGGGSIGCFVIQLAKAAGAFVYAVDKAEKAGPMKRWGADLVIDYQRQSFEEIVIVAEDNGVDIVVDCVGAEVHKGSFNVLKANGVLVSVVCQPLLTQKAESSNIGAFFHAMNPDGDYLHPVSQVIHQRRLKAPPISEMLLDEASDAVMYKKNKTISAHLILRIFPAEIPDNLRERYMAAGQQHVFKVRALVSERSVGYFLNRHETLSTQMWANCRQMRWIRSSVR